MSTVPVTPQGNGQGGTLAQRVRAKYPGAYDDMDDASLEKAIVAKYPQYADLAKQPSGQPGIGELVSPSGSLQGDINVVGRLAKITGKAAEEIGLSGGADPFGDALGAMEQHTGIPFLRSADKVNQAMETLKHAADLHKAWEGLKQSKLEMDPTKLSAWIPGAETTPPTGPRKMVGRSPVTGKWGEYIEPSKAQASTAPLQAQDKQTEQPKEQADLEAEAELKAAAKKPAADQTRIWQVFPGDQGLSQLADHVIRMEGDSKVARENNNPGNLKDPKTGEFQKFGSYEEGRSALIRQLNRWRDSNPDWTISDFNAVYAPDKSHGGDNPNGTEESRNRYLMKAISPSGE